jgi:hypothetical protein
MRHLASKILSSARSEIRRELEKFFKLDNSAMDNSAIENAIKPYLKEFDDYTPGNFPIIFHVYIFSLILVLLCVSMESDTPVR